jgi:hypothetical protein
MPVKLGDLIVVQDFRLLGGIHERHSTFVPSSMWAHRIRDLHYDREPEFRAMDRVTIALPKRMKQCLPERMKTPRVSQ